MKRLNRFVAGLLVTGSLTIGVFGATPTFAAGPCADPRGNAYCSTDLVTMATPDTSTQAGSSTTDGIGPAITIWPSAGLVGSQVGVVGVGLNARGRVSPMVAVNLEGELGGAIAMQPADGIARGLTSDGSLVGTYTVPAQATPGQLRVCIAGEITPRGWSSVCAPFTVTANDQPAPIVPVDGNLGAVAGHYQCSIMLMVGFGSMWCNGMEALVVLGSDGAYSWGAEQGTYTFDGSNIQFSGQLGSATVLNRLITITTNATGQQIIYRYIRMNY